MKLADYQLAAARTAQPAAYDRAYLIPMIVGEVGELFGQRAKSVWHGWEEGRLEEELSLEYGDVAWGVAILLDLEGIRSTEQYFEQPSRTLWGQPLDPWHVLLQKASAIHLFTTQADTYGYVGGEAAQLWMALERHCQEITGHDWETVLNANLAKLASRAERGVLQGSGDHR
jgi:hypothetical protein